MEFDRRMKEFRSTNGLGYERGGKIAFTKPRAVENTNGIETFETCADVIELKTLYKRVKKKSHYNAVINRSRVSIENTSRGSLAGGKGATIL